MKLHLLPIAVATLVSCPLSGVQAAVPDAKPAPATSVQVTNTTSNPVPVTVPDGVSISGDVNIDAARQPFQTLLCTIGWPPGCLSSASSSLTVPTDKRLVIEYISGQCLTGNATDIMGFMSISTRVGTNSVSHYAVPVLTLSFASGKSYVVAQQTRIYADQGTLVSANASSTTGDVGCLVALSGYLVSP